VGKVFQLDGTNYSVILEDNMYEDFVECLNNLVIVCRLTDGTVRFSSSGQNAMIFFHKDKISFILTLSKNHDKKLNKVTALFSKDEQSTLKKIFYEDIDIDISEVGKDVKVYTNLKSAFVKLLKKLQCV
jgi:hypothetical protein